MTLLSACALLRPAPPGFDLLPPSSYGGSVRGQQLITFARGAEAQTLQAYVEITPQQILLVGTTALGQRVLTVRYDGAHLEARSALPEGLDPAQVLRDLQLVTWPADALRAGLGPDWSVLESAGLRRVLKDGAPVAEIHYAAATPWQGRSWLVHWRGEYTLSIDAAAAK